MPDNQCIIQNVVKKPPTEDWLNNNHTLLTGLYFEMAMSDLKHVSY